jgi:hypothetical protein
MTPSPGQFVQLDENPDSHFQVINVDAEKGTCWLRRWPIARNGSPPFSIDISRVRALDPVAA